MGRWTALCTLLVGLWSLQCSAQRPRVAIIGGGVAGASAAHYLRSKAPDAAITVFERGQMGGRAQELDYQGLTLELGASIIWERNYLLRELADAGGLALEPLPQGGLLALYDGRELVFAESRWRLLTLVRLLWRYWLSWWMVWHEPAAAFAKFEGIYALLDNGTTFERPAHLLQAVGLYDLTQASSWASLFEHLRETYGESSDLVGAELVAGVGRANYGGQTNLQLNALAGLVSLMPATQPGVLRVAGGNGRLPPAVLAAANATVRCPVAVTAVKRLGDGRYALTLKSGGGGGGGGGTLSGGGVKGAEQPALRAAAQQAAAEAGAGAGAEAEQAEQPFDVVIVAAPLEGSGLSVEGLKLPVIPARKYHQTVTTFVRGRVRNSYFGLSPQDEMPYSAVLTTEGSGVPWLSLGLAGRTAPGGGAGASAVKGNATVWKLFSREPLPHAWTEMLFESGYEVAATKAWASPGAYPAFDPPEDFAPFVLAPGLYYAAALENAASAMEVAAIEGRMAALLAVQHLASEPAGQQASGGVLARGGGAAAAQPDGAAAAA